MKVLWVTTWNKPCGIATYSKGLLPALSSLLVEEGGEAEVLPIDSVFSIKELLQAIESRKPDVVHFQHEYGIWGGKNPPFYMFPGLVDSIRCNVAGVVCVATAHTVLSSLYRFPVKGRGLQIPFRALANLFLLPFLRRSWGEKTFGNLDGVIVHSKTQVEAVRASGCGQVVEIPHYVYATEKKSVALPQALSNIPENHFVVLVFGFFSPEKGQDIAIEALAKLPEHVHLVLAGGVRRKSDRDYYKKCLDKIQELKLEKRITITGFVPEEEIAGHYQRASLVLAPFRETTGSGTLAQAFARGAPVLTSDLILNKEVADRESGSIDVFEAGSARDCARKIESYISDVSKLEALKEASQRYANVNHPDRIAKRHLDFYKSFFKHS